MSSRTTVILLALLVYLSDHGGVTDCRAAAVFRITEVYTGVDGPDGTPDWFELTNVGDVTGSIGTFYYDDSSAYPRADEVLPNFSVVPGGSVIVLIEGTATDVPVFYSFWGLDPADVQVGFTDGGSLSQSRDTVNVFAGAGPNADVIDSVSYGGGLAGNQGTIERVHGGLTNSQLGVRGAFESVGLAFDNNPRPIIGSPGLAVPEPASIVMAGLGCVALALYGRRRRKE